MIRIPTLIACTFGLLFTNVVLADDLEAPLTVSVGHSLLVPIEGAEKIDWPSGVDQYPDASSNPEVLAVIKDIGAAGKKRIITTGKKIGSASLTCEYTNVSGTTEEVFTATIWVTQDLERATRILADFSRPNAVLEAELINAGERIRVKGTAASRSVLNAALRALVNRDLTPDSIQCEAKVLCPCCTVVVPGHCRARRR